MWTHLISFFTDSMTSHYIALKLRLINWGSILWAVFKKDWQGRVLKKEYRILALHILHEWSFVWHKNPPLVCDSKGKAVWKGLAYYDADYDGGRALTHAGPLHKAVAAAQCRRESRRRSVRARDVTPERQPASARKPGVSSRSKRLSLSPDIRSCTTIFLPNVIYAGLA